MKQAIKGALLSGLVFPGLGQMALKHHWRGLLFVTVALASTVYIVKAAVEEAMRSLPALDPAGIAHLPATSSADAGPGLWVLCLCWLWAVLDAYRLGDKRDRQG